MNISKESHQRLLNMPVPAAANRQTWQKIVTLSNANFLKALDVELGDGTSARDKMIIIGVAKGPTNLATIVGKGGKVTTQANRYFYHLIAVIDLVILVRGEWDESEMFSHLNPVQRSYQQMRRQYGNKGGPLAKGHIRMARVHTLVGLLNIHLHSSDFQFFLENYDALEPYLPIIVERKSMKGDHLKALIETQPELALAEGAL